MVYNWDDKEFDCYRLYVEEKKSLDEVISYWDSRGFTPSKRAFQTQFKRWEFPSKQNPAHKNAPLVARLQELWEQNYTQKNMVDTLQAEGFEISERELIRLRLRLKLLLRESVPRRKRKLQTNGGTQKKQPKKRPKVLPGKGLVNQLTNAILAEGSSSEEESEEEEEAVPAQQQHGESVQGPTPSIPEPNIAPLSAEEELRKQLRQEQLQVESDEKWRTRKRRRRTRGWNGLPADAPGEPPRFPSETTIDEAKAYLGLDNDMYRELRERFLQICKTEGVVKKTVVGPEKWAQIVQQLIRENAHLSDVFQQEPEVLQNDNALFRPKGQRALSLDVICMDVTKRLRTMDNRMTLADAKNALNLNPEQTRRVRSAFVAKLNEGHFTNKHEAGEQLWTELKQAWINESELLVRALAQGEADPDHARKLKAMEVLARDVMKRLQQEKIAKDPSKKKQVHQGPGPGPAPPVTVSQPSTLQSRNRQSRSSSAADALQTGHFTMPAIPPTSDLQIDPSLLLAASDAAVLPVHGYHQPETQYQHQHDQYRPAPQPQHRSQPSYTPHTQQQYYPASPSQSMPLPIYFRLHAHSTTPFPNKTVWLSILHTPSVAEIRDLAMREHPGTVVHKLDGLVTYRGEGQRGEGQDREVVVEVGDDDELGAYLGHVRNGGQAQGQRQGKATFVVLLGMGSSGGFS